jgi:pyruvate formate-lyase activating enzyme-like uncharacterized protein
MDNMASIAQRAWRIAIRRITMNRRELSKIDTRIKAIKKAAQELKELSAEIPAIDRNTARILASVKMLEINITDVKDLI